MALPVQNQATAAASDAASGCLPSADRQLNTLASLLGNLDEATCRSDALHRPADDVHLNELARARLGVASSLFTALRAKHPPTAAHSLRVALGVSAWSLAMRFADEQCDMFETAALLHDIGKLGVPDHVLLKPGRLQGEEVLLMERHRQIGQEILSGCCASPELLDVILHATAWFNGAKHGFERQGKDLPLGSRMIAIVDAYDSMTTDHVYRRAMPRERALIELLECAGSQFDPLLVKEFCVLIANSRIQFNSQIARRWLRDIGPEAANAFWTLGAAPQKGPCSDPLASFHDRLLDVMHDGVVFLDEDLVIMTWNRAAERLTGLAASSVLKKHWVPSLLQMRDERDRDIADEDCPIARVLRGGTQSALRLCVAGRNKAKLTLDVHVAPVLAHDGTSRGAIVCLHDASSQITLEERVQTLHDQATRDPLTQVANRAEFERAFPAFVQTHLETGLPCSLIICDIDHFKKINDVHGHQAGDAALAVFAATLKHHARGGDFLARYGGEEFVILCADCDNPAATRRAEAMRQHVAEISHPELGNDCFTASFGVTELQAGDTPETLLRRADRALLQAKDSGRNLVVQLGTGGSESRTKARSTGWLDWFRSTPGETLLERRLQTSVPLNVAAEKLRGFVADQHAEILSVQENRVALKIDGQQTSLLRRAGDRPVPFIVELTFEEQKEAGNKKTANLASTLVHVVVRPRKQRDRRRHDAVERARQLLASLKSYLMAHEYAELDRGEADGTEPDNFLRRSGRILTHWLRK